MAAKHLTDKQRRILTIARDEGSVTYYDLRFRVGRSNGYPAVFNGLQNHGYIVCLPENRLGELTLTESGLAALNADSERRQ